MLIKAENPYVHENLRSVRNWVALKLVISWSWRAVVNYLCGLIVTFGWADFFQSEKHREKEKGMEDMEVSQEDEIALQLKHDAVEFDGTLDEITQNLTVLMKLAI